VAYRPLFALVGLTAVGGLFVIAGAAERYHGSRASENRQVRPRETETRQQENQILKKLVLVNSLNGLAVGLTAHSCRTGSRCASTSVRRPLLQ